MARVRWCDRCDLALPVAHGLCMTCYQYRRRTGKDRPLGNIHRTLVRNEERRIARREGAA